MIARWSVERKAATNEGDLLQVVEVYAPGENKEVVKAENRQYTHRRELLLVANRGVKNNYIQSKDGKHKQIGTVGPTD